MRRQFVHSVKFSIYNNVLRIHLRTSIAYHRPLLRNLRIYVNNIEVRRKNNDDMINILCGSWAFRQMNSHALHVYLELNLCLDDRVRRAKRSLLKYRYVWLILPILSQTLHRQPDRPQSRTYLSGGFDWSGTFFSRLHNWENTVGTSEWKKSR